MLIILIAILSLSALACAFAWNPETVDLKGTNTSSNIYPNDDKENKFDIYTNNGTIYGIQVGEDFISPDSIAFLIKLDMARIPPNRFTVAGLDKGDQYEVYFSVREKSFCILFYASGPRRGTCALFEKTDGSWISRVSLTVRSIDSGQIYNTMNYEIGFILTDAERDAYGSVKFIISKQYLYSLGARGNLVTGIYATTRSGGGGTPGSGTQMDRCPASGAASWALQGDIPDLPAGILLLAFPIIAIYAYLKRFRRVAAYGFKATL